jgi:hypothetical protein
VRLTAELPALVTMVNTPCMAAVSGRALTFTARLCPGDSVTGSETDEVEKALFDKDSALMVTAWLLLDLMVSGCDVTLPLEPLKLRAAVEMLMPVELEALAQRGLARMIAARGRKVRCFTTIAPE